MVEMTFSLSDEFDINSNDVGRTYKVALNTNSNGVKESSTKKIIFQNSHNYSQVEFDLDYLSSDDSGVDTYTFEITEKTFVRGNHLVYCKFENETEDEIYTSDKMLVFIN